MRCQLSISLAVLLVGCYDSGDDGPPPDANFVEAQFDPTNDIPVLRLLPFPASLLETPDGIDYTPAPCEGETVAGCLELARGWPVDSTIQFPFSKPLDAATIPDAVSLYRRSATGFEPVPFTFEVTEQEPPPEACMSGDNGSDPPLEYTEDDVPGGVMLELTPEAPLTPGTQYFAFVESSLVGEGDLPVYSSAVFEPLNVARDGGGPISEDGTVHSQLLEFNLQAFLLTTEFETTDISALSDEDRERLERRTKELGQALFPVSEYVGAATQPIVDAGLTTHDAIIVATTFTTVDEPATIELDPETLRLPLPNAQLGLDDDGFVVADTGDAFFDEQLGMLTGFTTTGTFVVYTSTPAAAASLVDRVLMMPMDEGDPIDLDVQVQEDRIILKPIDPLAPDTEYAVGILEGVTDRSGRSFIRSALFDLLALPEPLTESDQARKVLRCSTSSTGELLPENEVTEMARQLEDELRRDRWQRPLEAFEPTIDRDRFLLAWTHRTERFDPPAAANGTLTYDTTIPAAAIPTAFSLVEQLCVPACQAGQLPPITDCTNTATVAAHPGCTGLLGAVVGNIDRIEVFTFESERFLEGNPFSTGAFGTPVTETSKVYVVIGVGAPAPAGIPVAFFIHGIGSAKEAGLFMANALAKETGGDDGAGWATVMMDLPYHGQRGADLLDASGQPCTEIDPLTQMCDGAPDPSGTGFLTPNPIALRDNLRQAAVDHLALLDALGAAGPPIDRLDLDRLAVVGHSVGGFVAARLLAFEPSFESAVLIASGGDVTSVLFDSVPEISQPFVDAGLPQDLYRWVLDPVDPIGLSAITPDRPILLQSAELDPVIHLERAEALQRVHPLADLEVFPVDCHGFALGPLCARPTKSPLCTMLGAQHQAAGFVSSSGGRLRAQTVQIPGLCP